MRRDSGLALRRGHWHPAGVCLDLRPEPLGLSPAKSLGALALTAAKTSGRRPEAFSDDPIPLLLNKQASPGPSVGVGRSECGGAKNACFRRIPFQEITRRTERIRCRFPPSCPKLSPIWALGGHFLPPPVHPRLVPPSPPPRSPALPKPLPSGDRDLLPARLQALLPEPAATH